MLKKLPSVATAFEPTLSLRVTQLTEQKFCVNGFIVYIHAISMLVSMNGHFCRLVKINSVIPKDTGFILRGPVSIDTDTTEISVCQK